MDKGVFHYEPTSKNAYDVDLDDMDFNGDMSDEDRLLMFNNMFQQDYDPDEESKLPRGLSFDWSKPLISRRSDVIDSAYDFFQNLYPKEATALDIPKMTFKNKQVHYNIKYSNEIQKFIIMRVLDTVKQWISWKEGKQSDFQPLRMTVCGKGGCGKSFVINCIVSHLRRMFQCNSVVHTVAPTGAAAFNVNGETIHRFAQIAPNLENNDLGKSGKVMLSEKLKVALALLIDERSMITNLLMGALEKRVAETLHECCHGLKNWGRIREGEGALLIGRSVVP